MIMLLMGFDWVEATHKCTSEHGQLPNEVWFT